MFLNFWSRATCVAACTLFSACSTLSVPDKPDTVLKDVPAPSFANTPFTNGASLPLQSRSPWWTQFQDPDLDALIATALAQNISIELAKANIQTAQAQLNRTRLGASYSTGASVDSSLGIAASPNQNIDLTTSTALSASWEYDAFGRIEAEIKAAEFNQLATEQAARDVAVLVSANTAIAYITLRGAQSRLKVARENAESQKETLEILENLVENGRSTDLDLRRSEAQYRTTLATIPNFIAAQQRAVASLAALTGTYANTPNDALTALSLQAQDIPVFNGSLLTGNVEELLRRRPDIRVAEARIGQLLALSDVERARLFPTLTFNANIFSVFNGTNRVDQLSSLGFGLGPAISWEGPDLRAVRADITIADRLTEAAALTYQQTVITAISEVEQAMSTYVQNLARLEDLQKAADAAREARSFADIRFEEGLDDFLDVLDAQRTLLVREDQLADAKQLIGLSAISLYQALGGI